MRLLSAKRNTQYCNASFNVLETDVLTAAVGPNVCYAETGLGGTNDALLAAGGVAIILFRTLDM